MSKIETQRISRALASVTTFLCVVTIMSVFSLPAQSAALPLGDEQNFWSDMLLSSGFGGFDNGLLTISSLPGPANLEIGSQFGPSDSGWHYGPSGTRGGATSARLIISRLFLNPDGTLKNNESLVTLSYGGNSARALGEDYGLTSGTALLRGKVTEVLLDAAGDDTLDILFTITGGALQEPPNSVSSIGQFSPTNVGVFRFTAPNLPSNWSSNFEFDTTSLHVFGIPEPRTFLFACFAGILVPLVRSPRQPKRRDFRPKAGDCPEYLSSCADQGEI